MYCTTVQVSEVFSFSNSSSVQWAGLYWKVISISVERYKQLDCIERNAGNDLV